MVGFVSSRGILSFDPMNAWHFTPQPADLPINQVQGRFYHSDMLEEWEMILGRLSGSEVQPGRRPRD